MDWIIDISGRRVDGLDIFEFWTERCAIMEFDGLMTRSASEVLATSDIVRRFGMAAGSFCHSGVGR